MVRSSKNSVENFCAKMLIKCGVPEKDASIISTIITDTSLDGLDTHGLSRFPQYIASLLNRRINACPTIQVTTNGSVAKIDGDNGMGQLLAYNGINTAIALAKKSGIGLTTVKHSNHFGAASYYCKMAANQGMIGIVFTNAPSSVAPWGGKKPYFGTNPIAFGFPAKSNPIIVDLSSSAAARGHILFAAKEGKTIPLGWALDKEGKPTTDAKEALDGALLALGGGKGYALALGVEVMAGILTGSAFGDKVGFIYNEGTDPVDIGHTFITVNVESLMPLEEFHRRIEVMLLGLKSTPLADGFGEIRIPGERRYAIAMEREENGISISPNLIKELNDLALELGMAPLPLIFD